MQAIRATVVGLESYYLPSNTPESTNNLLTKALTPACDVGMKVVECQTAYARLNSSALDVMSLSDLDALRMAHQIYQEEDFGPEVNLQGSPGASQQTFVLPLTPRSVEEDIPTLFLGWLGGSLVIFAFLAILIKTIRLVGENSTNYLFLALFMMLVAVVGSIIGGSLYINLAFAAALSFFGVDWALDVQGDHVLLLFLLASIIYLILHVLRGRSSKLARLYASFLLFFLIAFSFYFPFMSLPWVGALVRLGGSTFLTVTLSYFIVLYEGCYYLTRRVMEAPH